MADLLLSGMLNFKGTLNLVASGGVVKANHLEVLVEVPRGQAGKAHGQAPAPVPIPSPASPSDPGLEVWIFKSFNTTVTAGGKNIVTQGMCAQGNPSQATWPGMVQRSINNPGVTINNIPMNVKGDMGTILPTGAPVTFTAHGQESKKALN
ncbi:hypothetical protein HYR99_35545 [Candidatus Poribacteria bacterium]|nr:hypothetical protein [Candidatus Poribacteria bacterium]